METREYPQPDGSVKVVVYAVVQPRNGGRAWRYITRVYTR